MDKTIENKFISLLNEAEISPETVNIEKQLAFIELLHKWNKAFNLTAIKNKEEMVVLHLMDSLVIAPFINRKRILDVGAGAGLPGIPLAIMHPEKRFTLIDGNGKKTRFMKQAAIELQIPNIDIVHNRVEKYSDREKFDIITSRAFSTIPEFISLTKHLIKDGGEYLAMKGTHPKDEIAKIDDDFFCKEVVSLRVPGLDAERNLIQIQARK